MAVTLGETKITLPVKLPGCQVGVPVALTVIAAVAPKQTEGVLLDGWREMLADVNTPMAMVPRAGQPKAFIPLTV